MTPPPFNFFVIPAKAGIQACKSSPIALDPGFRRGDGRKRLAAVETA